MERNNTGAAVAWLAGGVILGAAVTLLLAPETGKKARRRLIKEASRGQRLLSDSSQDLVDRGRELYERGRELAEEAAELFERGRSIAEKKIHDAV